MEIKRASFVAQLVRSSYLTFSFVDIFHSIWYFWSPNRFFSQKKNLRIDLPCDFSKILGLEINPPTRFGVHSLLFLCSIQNSVTRCPSKIPSPKSKIQDPQNPKSPKSKIPKFQNPNFAHKDLLHNVPKIQNPKSPKSRKSKIQNPQNPKSPKSKIPKAKIQNPHNPKSKIPKIPKIQNPHNPKSKIQNPQNPSFFGRILGILDLGFWILGILDFGFFGFGIPAPKSKIQTPQNPKSPKSKILRRNPKFGALGASRKELLPNDAKS